MFKETPATEASIKRRKLIYGVGINDAKYQVNPTINGKRYKCPIYSKWNHMIERCYCSKSLKKRPNYFDCSVCEEWLIFSNFRSWMIKQDWKNKHLDKDIVKTNNKTYSPETCIFVSLAVNNLLCDRAAARGKYPQGVSFDVTHKKIKASCSIKGKKKHIGHFDSAELASKAYKAFKSRLIIDLAAAHKEPLRGYLIRISAEFLQ